MQLVHKSIELHDWSFWFSLWHKTMGLKIFIFNFLPVLECIFSCYFYHLLSMFDLHTSRHFYFFMVIPYSQTLGVWMALISWRMMVDFCMWSPGWQLGNLVPLLGLTWAICRTWWEHVFSFLWKISILRRSNSFCFLFP